LVIIHQFQAAVEAIGNLPRPRIRIQRKGVHRETYPQGKPDT
jgi:hypothetical protein